MPESPAARWSDLHRPPLDAAALTTALGRDGGPWRAVDVVDEIGSTNAALLARAAGGEPEGAVLVAEHQVTGRGRLDRSWTSPPRAGLTVSLLLRPDVPAARRGWLPLLAGVALAEAVSTVSGVRVSLKWPNDLLAADGRKLAGILAEATSAGSQPGGPAAVVVGLGLNVSTRPDELPERGASLAMITGGRVDRAPLLLAYLRGVARRYTGWVDALGDPVGSGLAREYLAWCSTVGRQVRVTLPDGSTITGGAQSVDWDGRLVVATAGGPVELASGDVLHLRPA